VIWSRCCVVFRWDFVYDSIISLDLYYHYFSQCIILFQRTQQNPLSLHRTGSIPPQALLFLTHPLSQVLLDWTKRKLILWQEIPGPLSRTHFPFSHLIGDVASISKCGVFCYTFEIDAGPEGADVWDESEVEEDCWESIATEGVGEVG